MRFALTRLVFSLVTSLLIRKSLALVLVAPMIPTGVHGQRPISRQQAVDIAVIRGARAAVARADTLIGAAQLIAARGRDNPSVALTYAKAVPTYHAILDLPLDITGIRGARIRAAEAIRLASQYRFEFERAAAALDADTTYTRALAALERVKLSRRNARDADSLRRMAVVRRNAGDASELDVLLATVNAGQAANLAIADSVTLISSIFDLQTVMGLDTTRIAIVPSDSLTMPPLTAPSAILETALPIAAARKGSLEDCAGSRKRGHCQGVGWNDCNSRGVQTHYGLQVEYARDERHRIGDREIRRLTGVDGGEQDVQLA